MSSKSVVHTLDQRIILPEEIGATSAHTLSRRSLLQRGGVLAAAAPLGMGAAALMVSPSAHATDITVDATAKIATYSATVSGVAYTCNVFSTINAGCYIVVMLNSAGVGKIVYRGQSNTRFFNGGSYTTPSGVYRRYTLTNEAGSGPNSLFSGDIDGGRRLVDISWGNQANDVISETGSLAGTSDALILFWEKFTRAGTFYFAAVLNTVSGAAPAFSPVTYFSGTDYNTFANKKQTFMNAQSNLYAVQGRYRTTLALASCAAAAGVVGSVFSFGAAAAVLGGAIATFAGNAVLNGQALIDAQASVSTAWVDLSSWVESKCGCNLVR